MDAHYDQVMKARANASGGTRMYFAYSTVLDRQALQEWQAQHSYDFFKLPQGEVVKALDVKLVYDFPSRWWGGRAAGLVPAPGACVWGRLFEISATDWPIVMHKEGGVTGMSVEMDVMVETSKGPMKATAFATHPQRRSEDGAVSPRFVEALIRGAQSAGLPADWIAELQKTTA